MANHEQLGILKKGVEAWNKWRKEYPSAIIDLIRADLEGVQLPKIDLSDADLTGAFLVNANLNQANLWTANFHDATLIGANLEAANLNGAYLTRADLVGANLFNASLMNANLNRADLTGANLIKAHLDKSILIGTNLSKANLKNATFSNAYLSGVYFGSNDLSKVLGIKKVFHKGPSIIGIETFHKSMGRIPEAFLRGCGVSNPDIEYAKLSNPDLSNEEINKILNRMYDLRANQAIQISPLFISYSHSDSTFVDKLEKHLNDKGIRFWRDVHNAKAGRLEKQINRAIRQNPTVLVILSKHSIKSDWVEHEVRIARELEKETGHDVLCPIALDDSWEKSPWPKRVIEQVMEYNILDFSAWKDDTKFGNIFNKLIDGLGLFYKG